MQNEVTRNAEIVRHGLEYIEQHNEKQVEQLISLMQDEIASYRRSREAGQERELNLVNYAGQLAVATQRATDARAFTKQLASLFEVETGNGAEAEGR